MVSWAYKSPLQPGSYNTIQYNIIKTIVNNSRIITGGPNLRRREGARRGRWRDADSRHEECRRSAHLPSFCREPVGRETSEICDAWPVRDARLKVTSPAAGVTAPWSIPNYTACWAWQRYVYEQLSRGCCLKAERPGIEPATFFSRDFNAQLLHHQATVMLLCTRSTIKITK